MASKAGGEYPSKRFLDIINSVDEPADNRTPDEIVEQIRGSLRRLEDERTS